MTEHCIDCKFWDEHGRCHRYAPRPRTPNEYTDSEKDCRGEQDEYRYDLDPWNQDLSVWPITDASDWCGEYAPRE